MKKKTENYFTVTKNVTKKCSKLFSTLVQTFIWTEKFTAPCEQGIILSLSPTWYSSRQMAHMSYSSPAQKTYKT